MLSWQQGEGGSSHLEVVIRHAELPVVVRGWRGLFRVMELGVEDELPQQLGRARAAQRLLQGSLHCTGAITDQSMLSLSN